jgi:pyruvate dehydrogenase E2 component (dihydrolipoamide acetyltransferase)
MSTLEFKLPDIGEGVTEGEIVSWLVAAGDSIAQDQDMVEVMTDKATVTIGAPEAGVVKELRSQVGDTVPVGKVIVVLDTSAGGSAKAAEAPTVASTAQTASTAATPTAAKAEPSAKSAPTPSETKASAVGDIRDSLPGLSGGANGATAHFDENPSAAPATRKLARELGVDIKRVPPTGEAGRVTREDIERFAKGGAAPASPKAAPAPTAHALAPVPPAAPVPVGASEERVPLRGLRKRIYESMARSKHTAAHFTYVDECECTDLIALRTRLRGYAEEQGVKLTYLPFIIKAVVAALKKHPTMNTLVDDTTMEMVHRKTYDIGIAVATPSGLIVPVLRGADRLNIIEIARELERLAADAREGKSKREDLGGSSFTVTSLGRLGGLHATPVVNYPEVGILFVPEMKKRPVVKGDEIVVGHVMDLSLSFDHRIIDGYDGAEFTRTVIDLLQQPDRLVLAL